MIVTLTINPAIDRTVLVDRLAFDDRAYILSSTEEAGGRGINASRVIASFGGKTIAILTSGGQAGEKIQELLSDEQFRSQVVRIGRESRLNLTISDKQGLTVKLNERGALVTADELNQLRDLVESSISHASWLMLCGSLPPGVPPHFYCELIAMARAKKVRTLLDTDGDALLHALEEQPSVIKPNQQEAERLLNTALITRSQILEAAGRLRRMGPEALILSLGTRGAIAATAEEMWEVLPPRTEALCPIGAGDALAAAFVWGMDRKKTFTDAVRWGVAAGTASAALPGLSFASFEQTKAVYKQVTVRQAS